MARGSAADRIRKPGWDAATTVHEAASGRALSGQMGTGVSKRGATAGSCPRRWRTGCNSAPLRRGAASAWEARMENIDRWLLESGACCLFAASMVTDLRSRQIPNLVPIVLLALFPVYAFVGGIGPTASLWSHIMIGMILLCIGFALYLTGNFGAGDGKLLAVAGVWVGLSDMRLFLFGLGATALALSAFAMLPFERARRIRTNLPFALAIAPPAMIVVILRSLSHGP